MTTGYVLPSSQASAQPWMAQNDPRNNYAVTVLGGLASVRGEVDAATIEVSSGEALVKALPRNLLSSLRGRTVQQEHL